MTEPGSAAPPGWYRDHTGYPRWWGGSQWGPYAPPPEPPRDASRTLAVISHLGSVVGGFAFLLPLVIYLTEGEKSSFARHHAREALNFQLTFLILYLAGALLFFASLLLSFTGDFYFPSLIFPFPLFFLLWAGAIGFSVTGAVRANQHQWWRYPLTISFLKAEAAS